MIEVQNLTKHYGAKVAVNDVSFIAKPGEVTGFLGPNGAGKSTTMRLMLGLDRPTAGHAHINGKPYAAHDGPLSVAGALLDAKGVHPGRTARSHLRSLAATHRIPDSRVDEVLRLTGIAQVSKKRVGGFSLGMGQRLGIAAALLGDPSVVILDEPVNGLDPDGVMWIRGLLRHLAAEGRTVVLSSHLMSEMAQVADHVIIFGAGRVVANATMAEILQQGKDARTEVVTPSADALMSVLTASGARVESSNTGGLSVTGLTNAQIGELAAANSIALHELTPRAVSLEEAYLELTRDHVEYQIGAQV